MLNLLYILANVIPAAILTVTFGIVLYKVLKGSRFKFIITVAGLLLVSNLSTVVATLTENYNSHNDVSVFSIACYSIFLFLQFAAFNESHWLFAFQYFIISRDAEKVIKSSDQPFVKTRRDRLIKRTVSTFNIILPLLQSVCFCIFIFTYLRDSKSVHFWLDCFTYSLWGSVALQFGSGVLLGYAVLKIRKSVKENETEQ